MSREGSPSQPDTEDSSERSESTAEPSEESRIIIRPDGEVVIENLSELLAEVATQLDPDAELACRIEPEVADSDGPVDH